MNKRFLRMLVLMSVVLSFGMAKGVCGKDFPTKSIEFIVPMGPGGSTSLGARVIAGTLSEYIGVPVVVVNKPGGGGSVGAVYVAKAKPDGYTLLVTSLATQVIRPTIRAAAGYKGSDFEPLVQYGSESFGFVVKSDAPWKTLADLVADAKKEPGRLKYSSPGLGGSSHFAMELFKIAAGGLKIDHVPFKSGPEAVTAILGGHVHMSCLYMMDIKGGVEGGKLRMLTTPSEKRLEEYREVPTFVELNYPVVMNTWYGIVAPAGVPKEVSAILKDALYKASQHPDVKKMLEHVGCMPAFRNAEDFARFISAEEKKIQKIAQEAQIKIE